MQVRDEPCRAKQVPASWLAGWQAGRHDGGGGEGGGCVQTYHSAGTLVCQCSARSCEAQAQSLVVRGSGGSRAAG